MVYVCSMTEVVASQQMMSRIWQIRSTYALMMRRQLLTGEIHTIVGLRRDLDIRSKSAHVRETTDHLATVFQWFAAGVLIILILLGDLMTLTLLGWPHDLASTGWVTSWSCLNRQGDLMTNNPIIVGFQNDMMLWSQYIAVTMCNARGMLLWSLSRLVTCTITMW